MIVTNTDHPACDPAVLTRLQRRMHGDLLTSTDSSYAAARPIHNRRFTSRPALIARCRKAHDVALAIVFARERKLAIAVRSGGHSMATSRRCGWRILTALVTASTWTNWMSMVPQAMNC